VAIVALFTVAGLSIVADIVVKRANPILKGRVVEALERRFNSRVELDNLNVSVIHGLEVSGYGLRIYATADVVAAGMKTPIIAVQRFHFHADIKGLFLKPMDVGSVHVIGLAVHIPPREMRRPIAGDGEQRHFGTIKIVLDEIVCDDSQLVLDTSKPGKEPRVFVLRHVVLHDLGPDAAMPYDAEITNGIPVGEIHAVGHFGPWNNESPGDSAIDGHYTFDHADLYPIKGIGGTLHSTGDFTGQLNHIAVQGLADVPNFSLDSAVHPMPLHSEFSAHVDGTDGDTYLDQVKARLGASDFTCKGSVVRIKGQGHLVDLDVDIPAGRIQDFLHLAVKTQPVIMTGILQMRTHIHIPPGHESVMKKANIAGNFTLQQVHFTRQPWQEKIDELSLRAQGDPRDAKPGAPQVASQMTGTFQMSGASLNFKSIDYMVPGANVQMAGVYSLDGKNFDFAGTIRTEAKPSQMVVAPWKRLLLKAVDPFLAKDGAGMQVPFKVSGTESAPKFGLDFGHKHEASPR
jgi:hypothetical protein